MKLITQVKLQTTSEQLAALKQTMQAANRACDYISSVAWDKKTFMRFALHKLVYQDVRKQFGLSAQVVVRCIAKVADAYKLDKRRKRKFKPQGAITYDDRILSWQLEQSQVSLWTTNGRIKIPFVCGDKQSELLKTRQGESDLILFRDECYLSATCDVAEPEPIQSEGVLGVDLGVVNIAVDSDGTVYSGKTINNVRIRHRRLRTKLQKKGTHSAKRLLKKLAGKEARFAKDVNHTISKHVVRLAQGTRRAIALEDLKGIRKRVTVRRDQRATLHSWSFFQLRMFLAYKAQLAGVTVIPVDPRNTSRTCPQCGCVDKRNRPSQSKFSCVVCGYSGLADHIAARNIASRAVVNPPNVAHDEAKAVEVFVVPTELRSSAVTSHPVLLGVQLTLSPLCCCEPRRGEATFKPLVRYS
jgi:putative transposase